MYVRGREIHLVACGRLVVLGGLLLCLGGTDWLYPRASGPLFLVFLRVMMKETAFCGSNNRSSIICKLDSYEDHNTKARKAEMKEKIKGGSCHLSSVDCRLAGRYLNSCLNAVLSHESQREASLFDFLFAKLQDKERDRDYHSTSFTFRPSTIHIEEPFSHAKSSSANETPDTALQNQRRILPAIVEGDRRSGGSPRLLRFAL